MAAENLPMRNAYRQHLCPLHPGLKMLKLACIWIASILLSAPAVGWYVQYLPTNTKSQCGHSSLSATFVVMATVLFIPTVITIIILLLAAIKRRGGKGADTGAVIENNLALVSSTTKSKTTRRLSPPLAMVTVTEEDVADPITAADDDKVQSRHESVSSRHQSSESVPHLSAEALELLKQLQSANSAEDGTSRGSLKRKTSGRRSGKLETGTGSGGIERHPSVRYSVRNGPVRPANGGMTTSSTTSQLGHHKISTTERPVYKKRDSRSSRNSLSVEDIEDETRYPMLMSHSSVVEDRLHHNWARQRTASMSNESSSSPDNQLAEAAVNHGTANNKRASIDSVKSTNSKKSPQNEGEKEGSSEKVTGQRDSMASVFSNHRGSVVSLKVSPLHIATHNDDIKTLSDVQEVDNTKQVTTSLYNSANKPVKNGCSTTLIGNLNNSSEDNDQTCNKVVIQTPENNPINNTSNNESQLSIAANSSDISPPVYTTVTCDQATNSKASNPGNPSTKCEISNPTKPIINAAPTDPSINTMTSTSVSPNKRNQSYVRSKSYDVNSKDSSNNDKKIDEEENTETPHTPASRVNSENRHLVPRGPCADAIQPLMDGYDPSATQWNCWSVAIDDTSIQVVGITLLLTFLFNFPFFITFAACSLYEAKNNNFLETAATVSEWVSYTVSLVHPVVQMTAYGLKIRHVRQIRQAHRHRNRQHIISMSTQHQQQAAHI